MKSLLSCSVVTKESLLDIPRELEVVCYTALPVACIQTKSIDVVKDVYELDLLRYVTWYCHWPEYFYRQNMVDMATFFKWMKLKVRFEVIAYITSDG